MPKVTGESPIVLGTNPYNECGNYEINEKTGVVSLLVTSQSDCALEANIAYSVRMRSKLETDFT